MEQQDTEMKTSNKTVKINIKKQKRDLILEKKVQDYTSGSQNHVSNTKLAKSLKSRIKKCKNCNSNFHTLEAKKIYFPFLDYTYCSSCQFVLTQPNFKYKLYLTQPHQVAINNLYKSHQRNSRELDKSKTPDSDNCAGEFCGKPSQAGRKAAGRFWRKINYLTKNKVAGIEELIAEHNKQALELYESNKNTKTFDNMNKINLKNADNESEKEFTLTDLMRDENKTDLGLVFKNINGYMVYPMVKTVLERKRKIYYAPQKKVKQRFHYNYVNNEDQFTVKKIRIQPKRFCYSAIFSIGKRYLENLKPTDKPIDSSKSEIVWNCNVYSIK